MSKLLPLFKTYEQLLTRPGVYGFSQNVSKLLLLFETHEQLFTRPVVLKMYGFSQNI